MSTIQSRTSLRSGTPDPDFGNDGMLELRVGNEIATASAIVFDASNDHNTSLVTVKTPTGTFLGRRLENGDADTGFGTDGFARVMYAVDAESTVASAIHVLSSGKLLVVGLHGKTALSKFIGLTQFNADGSLDEGFGNLGRKVVVFDDHENGHGLTTTVRSTVQDKYIFVALSDRESRIARLTANGELDKTFNDTGFVLVTPPNARMTRVVNLFSLDNAIFAGGTVQLDRYSGFTTRLTASGAIDNGYGTQGYRITTVDGKQAHANFAITVADSTIVLGGGWAGGASNDARGILSSCTQGGQNNPDFNGGNDLYTPVPGTNMGWVDATTSSDHMTLVAYARPHNQPASLAIARFSLRGELDTDFAENGWWIQAGGDTDARITTQTDGRLLVIRRQWMHRFLA